MTFNELKIKASSLPMEPGVYLMQDADGNVIYVGKAKKLKNRVSQYFQESVSHTPKTRLMVSKVRDFSVIIASSEFEALVLECAQIKRYMPKYNILLKDDKGYPYLRLDWHEAYPRLTMVSRVQDDRAEYFGPYGSRGATQNLLNTIQEIFKLPVCNKQFPRDLKKGRPCLNYHLNRCAGWCNMDDPREEYYAVMEQVRQLLRGNFNIVAESLRNQMLQASDMLNFELAATLRDKIQSVQNLGKKQFMIAGSPADIDVIGYGQTESKACFAVLHFSDGELVDKDYEIVGADDRDAVVSSLLKQYYLSKGYAPSHIFLPFEVEDSHLFEQLLYQRFQKKIKIKIPQRGDNLRLVEIACKNALEEAQRITGKEEHYHATMEQLRKMLSISKLHRIESYDISNISGTDNVASMVVFVNGNPSKKDYKRFKVDNCGLQDDYASMRQVLMRRFSDHQEGKKGFTEMPDLVLVDGGAAHAKIAEDILSFFQYPVPVFGMVKDDRHRTRALVSAKDEEIGIDHVQSVFSFIGKIQEETHRFAITYHRKLRSNRLRYSQLDRIPGIGPKRKQMLLKHFSSISAIKDASIVELRHYLPENAASAVYSYFHSEEVRNNYESNLRNSEGDTAENPGWLEDETHS